MIHSDFFSIAVFYIILKSKEKTGKSKKKNCIY